MAKINGQQVLSDATTVNCLNNRIPIKCINDKVLEVDNKGNWVLLNRTPHSQTVIQSDVVLRNGGLKVNVTKEATEYDALALRNVDLGKTGVLSKRLNAQKYKLDTSSVSVKNQRKDPYTLSYSFDVARGENNNKISFNPFFHEIAEINMFAGKERTYPVDLIYPDKKKYVTHCDPPQRVQAGVTAQIVIYR